MGNGEEKQLQKTRLKVAFLSFLTELPNFIGVTISAILSGSLIVWMDFVDSFCNVLQRSELRSYRVVVSETSSQSEIRVQLRSGQSGSDFFARLQRSKVFRLTSLRSYPFSFAGFSATCAPCGIFRRLSVLRLPCGSLSVR